MLVEKKVEENTNNLERLSKNLAASKGPARIKLHNEKFLMIVAAVNFITSFLVADVFVILGRCDFLILTRNQEDAEK